MYNLKGVKKMLVQGVLDFLSILPLEEQIEHFEIISDNRINVVTNKQEFECTVKDMSKFVNSVFKTEYLIFDKRN